MLIHLNDKIKLPSRVVILGADGFVGSTSRKKLQGLGIDVLSLPRTELDLTDKNAANKLSRILKDDDVLIFISAKAPVKDEEMLILNLQIGKSVCEALRKKQIKQVIYVSSDAVYADSDAPLTEQSCAQPSSLHGIMHLTREVMIKNVFEGCLCIIRPSLIYGPRDPHNGYGPNKFIRLAKKNLDIEIFGNGEEQRDHVFIDDVASIFLMLILHQATGILNIASGKLNSFLSIAEVTIDNLKSKSNIKKISRSGPIPHNGYREFDISNFKKVFPNFEYKNFNDIINQIQGEY